MKDKKLSTEWAVEFQEFISTSECIPPKGISTQIFEKVHTELNPSVWRVFLKAISIHLVIGTITLLFCPQFGIGLFQGMGLMSLFMHFGETACMLGCGAVFLGSSALAASLILKPEEVKVIRRTEFLQFTLLSTFSIGFFICLGTIMVTTLALAWLIGSILGALGSLELGWRIRLHFIRKAL